MTERVRDRYELLGLAGEGGEGSVYKAIDHRHHRLVAMKVRRGAEADTLAEARALLALRPHPSLPVVREDFAEGDRHYLVLDWVDGISLERLLAEQGRPGLPPSDVARYVTEAAAALDHLHSASLVHNDVKPGNLVLTSRGGVVLVDLGSAGAEGARVRGSTNGFAAPELATKGGSPASDVYALAATTFALLTGSQPEAGADRRNVPQTWLEPLERALAADPAARLQRAGEFAASLAGGAGPPRRRLVAGIVTASAVLAAALVVPRLASSGGAQLGAPQSDPVAHGPAGAAGPGPGSTAPSAKAPTGVASKAPDVLVSSGRPQALPGSIPSFQPPRVGVYRYSVDYDEDGPSDIDDRSGRDVDAGFEVGTPEGGGWSFRMQYASDDEKFPGHEELLHYRFTSRGVEATFERFDIRACGAASATQACVVSEAVYEPAVLLASYPSSRAWSGTSRGRRPGDGKEIRVERYEGTVRGWEKVRAGSAVVDALVVRWVSTFSGQEQGRRERTLWFAPSLGIPVRGLDVLSMTLQDGVYTSDAEWTLTRLPA